MSGFHGDPTRWVRSVKGALSRQRAPGRTETHQAVEVVAVVGHGMVGHHFCEQLARLDETRRFRVEVFGEEPVPAYDRVHLARVVEGSEPLPLYDEGCYEKWGVYVHLGVAVTGCGIEQRCLQTSNGTFAFDKLVFATGSAPVRPKIPGLDSERVTVYRDARDAYRIRALGLRTCAQGAPAVIIGAGLLGLEAAQALRELGCDVLLVESAAHLLPRQLDGEVAARLRSTIEQAGFETRTGARVERIESKGSLCRVQLDTGEQIDSGMVLVAAGVRPRDELARQAGIHCDLFGGIEVDDALETSVEGVYAIGECARHRGHSYGLVAPGRQMADVLARRLVGKDDVFAGAEVATRLKLPHLDLTVIGQSNVRDLSTFHVSRATATSLQKLVVRKGRLIGLSVIGEWPELHLAQAAIATKERLRNSRLKAFEEGKPLFRKRGVDLGTWPEATTVCNCMGVSCGALKRAHEQGASSVEALSAATGAGTVCGTCTPLLASLLNERPPRASQTVTAAAVVVLLIASSALLFPPIPYTRSVQGISWDALWRDPLAKQVSGFSLVFLLLLGLLLSLRKRTVRLKRFSHAQLRAFHVLMGASAAGLYLAHTGLRLGANLDLVLALTFLLSSVSGAFASLLPRLVEHRPSWMRLKSPLERVHLYLVWPLPVLLGFHVLKVYFF